MGFPHRLVAAALMRAGRAAFAVVLATALLVSLPLNAYAQGLLLGVGSPGATLTSYEGLVSGPYRFPNTNVGGNTGTAKIPQVATENLTTIKVIVANFMLTDNSASESNNGGVATVGIAIEYPVDPTEATPRQLAPFSSAATGTIAAGGLGTTDALTLSTPIPKGATFNVWYYYSNPNGLLYYSAASGFAAKQTGEKFGVNVGNVTVTGTLTNGTSTDQLLPIVAVVAQTTQPSVVAMGDSIIYGVTGASQARDEAVNGRVGIVGRGVPTTIAELNLGGPGMMATPGDAPTSFASVFVSRCLLVKYGSTVVNDLGVNDLRTLSVTGANDNIKAANLAAANSNIAASACFRAGQTKLLATITPDTTSSNSFVDTAGQTVATGFTPRPAYNDLVRAGVSGYNGFWETADALESAHNSNLWAANGSTFFVTGSSVSTTSGLHPNLNGYAVNAASAQMTANLAKVHYP